MKIGRIFLFVLTVLVACSNIVWAEKIILTIQEPSEGFHQVVVGAPGTMIDSITFSVTGVCWWGEYVCCYWSSESGWDCGPPSEDRRGLVFNVTRITNEGRVWLVSEGWYPISGEFDVTEVPISTSPIEGGELEIQIAPGIMIDSDAYCCESVNLECMALEIYSGVLELQGGIVLSFDVGDSTPSEKNTLGSIKALYR